MADKMLVRDVIQAIQNKELSIKQLSDQYKVSDRTVQNKIKKLGFKWNYKAMQYSFEGEDSSVLEMEFSSLFNGSPVSNNMPKAESSDSTKMDNTKPKKPKKELKSSFSTYKAQSREERKAKATERGLESMDIIDLLLMGKKDTKNRTYRGFYFDKDVLEIVDQAGNKSELINEALRRVFKEKGLL